MEGMKFLWAVGYIAALGILAHIVGQARRWFDPDRFPYRCAPWEQNGRVWRKLGVHRWKDHVPDMSRIMGDMVKKKLPDGNTPEGLRVLVLETCVAECVHWWLAVASLGIFFFWRGGWAVVFCLVYNLLGNLPFQIIQRYNRPRLRRLAEKNNLDLGAITAYHIGFVIGPCLNAGGRLKTAKEALALLRAQSEEEAERYDAALEPMEKKHLPSQEEFYIMSRSFVEG